MENKTQNKLERKLTRREELKDNALEAHRQWGDGEISVWKYLRIAYTVYLSDRRAYFEARRDFKEIDHRQI